MKKEFKLFMCPAPDDEPDGPDLPPDKPDSDDK